MVKLKNLKSRMPRIAVFILGFCICCYPIVSGVIESHDQKNAIRTYEKSIENQDAEKIKKMLQEAHKYNDVLYQTMGAAVGNSTEVLSDESYKKQLDLTGTGIMGSLEIPKINVNLPIYHGTSDEVLSRGIGHLQDSSLPVGGINTRSMLTGHRGLPTSKLFTRLDELEKDDLFFIKIADETLAYQVIEIIEIKPEEIDKLATKPDQDLVSLITCTPYGINTHRLIVTGQRVDYIAMEHDQISSSMMSSREIVFTILPFVFVMIALYPYIKKMIMILKRKEKKSKDEIKKEI